MSFNLDDPLAGILSDGSDDSFFDDDVLGKKKPQKKVNVANEKKNSLFDLGGSSDAKGNSTSFGLQGSLEKPKSNTPGENITESRQDSNKSPILSKSIRRKDSLKFQVDEAKNKSIHEIIDVGKSPHKTQIVKSIERLDLLDELPIENKKEATKPLQRGKSSQSLLDDILGAPSTKSSGTGIVVKASTTKSSNFDLDALVGKSDSKKSLASAKKESIKTTTSKNAQPNKGATSDDWLGIFKDKDEESDNDERDMPAWLVGNSTKKKKILMETEPPKNEQILTKQEMSNEENIVKAETQIKIDTEMPEIAIATTTSHKLEISEQDITLEGAALCLQQQESQLTVALQLKAQDEKLAAMQRKYELI